MWWLVGLTILLLILILHYNYDVVVSTIDGLPYRVVSEDSVGSANTLAYMNEFLVDFIKYLRKKYVISKQINDKCLRYFGGDAKKQIQFVKNLIYRYNPSVLREHFPTNLSTTSYVKDKGREVVFCLRDSDGGIFDKHTLKFVALHEFTHIGCDEYGHPESFWQKFKFILIEAINIGYAPVDYKEFPIDYCGLRVNYNPYFDQSL